MDWRHRAACLKEDPELFFPIGNTGPALLQIEEAKTVCRRCEVAETCLHWALESGQDAGGWGGLGEDERRALMRGAARARRAGGGSSSQSRHRTGSCIPSECPVRTTTQRRPNRGLTLSVARGHRVRRPRL